MINSAENHQNWDKNRRNTTLINRNLWKMYVQYLAMTSNHNIMTIVMYIHAIALQLVNVCVAVLNKQSWKTYRINMMNLRKLSLSPRHQYLPTRNKPTLLGNVWLVIRNSEHILGSLNRPAFDSPPISLHTKHKFLLYWDGCGKVHKFRKTGPLRDHRNLVQSAVHHCRKSCSWYWWSCALLSLLNWCQVY